MKLAVLYAIFAFIATIANIAAQELAIRIYSLAFAIPASVAVGTAVGLVTKYILDKRYIFRFQARDVRHDGVTFAAYAVVGVFTTAVFWGFEFGFHHLFQSKSMRYLGGVLGLAIGYLAKFHLDKRYVFRSLPS